jgi:D-alanine--poly(phosphoribitol) ligase subunit 1
MEYNGALAIGGNQVFKGYYQSTQECFSEIKNESYYLSGDDIRLDENEKWVFKGRTDQQIQVQGYRVELQEIQSVIKYVYGCFSVVVFYNDYLYLFIVSDKTLKLELKNHLPWYMLPKKTLFLNEFPLNKNQKTDYDQLKKLIK